MLLTADWPNRLAGFFGLATQPPGNTAGGAQAFWLMNHNATHQEGNTGHYRDCCQTETDRDPQGKTSIAMIGHSWHGVLFKCGERHLLRPAGPVSMTVLIPDVPVVGGGVGQLAGRDQDADKVQAVRPAIEDGVGVVP